MTWVARLLARRRHRPVPLSVRSSPAHPEPADAVAATADVQRRLEELREIYVEHVNCAVAEGRLDLVAELVDDYTDKSLAVLTAVLLDP